MWKIAMNLDVFQKINYVIDQAINIGINIFWMNFMISSWEYFVSKIWNARRRGHPLKLIIYNAMIISTSIWRRGGWIYHQLLENGLGVMMSMNLCTRRGCVWATLFLSHCNLELEPQLLWAEKMESL